MKEKYNNDAVSLLLANGYAALSTEDQTSIFGVLCLHLVLAAQSAREGDYAAANYHLVQGGLEEKEVNCPPFLELFLAASKYIDGLESGDITLNLET